MLTRHRCAFLAECRKGPSSAQSSSSCTCQTSQSLGNRTPAHCLPTIHWSILPVAPPPNIHAATCKRIIVDAVQTWSSDWNATFNSAKSQQMVVGRHGCETGGNRVLGGDKLQQVCTVSHLGLTLASTLKWSDHVSDILKRAAPTAAALKKLGYRARVSVDTMSLLYKTILRPRLEYASIAWDNCSAADSRRLERLQLSVARAVMHQRRHPSMSKSQLLKQLGWPTLARCRRAKLIYFWKLVNNQGPPCLSSRIPKSVNNRCEYSLRNTGAV